MSIPVSFTQPRIRSTYLHTIRSRRKYGSPDRSASGPASLEQRRMECCASYGGVDMRRCHIGTLEKKERFEQES
jgi:hypothetical protein